MKKFNILLFWFFSLLLPFVFFNCAGQIPPSGGPPDLTPPEIISTYPEQNTANFHDNHVQLEFSKYVERRSVEESIFISPFIGALEFDWSGTNVEIRFFEQLKRSTTYVVNVGTDVVDLRNHNRMAKAFTLAFSTAAQIDTAMISGRVFDSKPEGVMIFAYRLNSLNPDTLNPSVLKPDYITQTGKDGVYTLSHLAFGTYRLFAVRDEFRNLLYDAGADQFGGFQSDVVLSGAKPSMEEVNFQLSTEDTTRPQLFTASAPDRNHVRLQFGEPVDTSSIHLSAFSIEDTLTSKSLSIFYAFLDLQTPRLLTLVTNTQTPKAGYKVTVDGVTDLAGNLIHPQFRTAIFSGSEKPDTLAPQPIFFSIKDSTRQVPLDESIEVSFNDIVNQNLLEQHIAIKDSSGALVRGKIFWKTPAAFVYEPQGGWQSLMWYSLHLPMTFVKDPLGNVGKDTTVVIHFQTIDKNLLGSIEGIVTDMGSRNGRGRIFLSATDIVEKNKKQYRTNILELGKFTIENIMEGKYTLEAFRDSDGNGKYSYGRPFLFIPSERFVVYPDTIKVRARWPVEGVVIQFK